MALVIGETEIPSTSCISFNGNPVSHVIYNDTIVWPNSDLCFNLGHPGGRVVPWQDGWRGLQNISGRSTNLNCSPWAYGDGPVKLSESGARVAFCYNPTTCKVCVYGLAAISNQVTEPTSLFGADDNFELYQYVDCDSIFWPNDILLSSASNPEDECAVSSKITFPKACVNCVATLPTQYIPVCGNLRCVFTNAAYNAVNFRAEFSLSDLTGAYEDDLYRIECNLGGFCYYYSYSVWNNCCVPTIMPSWAVCRCGGGCYRVAPWETYTRGCNSDTCYIRGGTYWFWPSDGMFHLTQQI